MKPSELTPEALMKFFSELEGSGGEDGECEIHYGCSCVIEKGRRAAQMLLDIQKTLGVQPGSAAPPEDDEAAMTARIMEIEAALTQPDAPPQTDANAEALQEAEGEIDRLLVQNVELKEQNGKLREKVRDLYKQVERLYTRSEMSKLLGTLDEKIEQEARKEGDTGEESAEDAEAPTEEAPDEVAEDENTQDETDEAPPETSDEPGDGEETAASAERSSNGQAGPENDSSPDAAGRDEGAGEESETGAETERDRP